MRGTHVDRFRTVAVCISRLIQSSPVSMSAPASRSFASTASRVSGCALRQRDLAAGNRRGHQESPGFNTVRQHTVDAAAQALHAFDGNAIATLACDFCAQRVQEAGGIDNLRSRAAFSIIVVPSASVAALMMSSRWRRRSPYPSQYARLSGDR